MPSTMQRGGAHAQGTLRGRQVTRLVAGLARRERGSVTAIAALLDVDRTTVSHWLGESAAARDYYVPADALPAICDALGTFEPLRVIADELGLELVPRGTTPSTPSVRRAVCALMRDVGSLGVALDEALEDGAISGDESQEIDALLVAIIEGAKAARARIGGAS